MARRKLKLLTPLLVGLVAVVLGFLAIGPSSAGIGDDSSIPASTTSVSTSPQDATPGQTALPIRQSAPKPKNGKTVDPGPVACASCMAPTSD